MRKERGQRTRAPTKASKRYLFDTPDLICVLRHGPVTRKLSHTRDVQDGFSGPTGSISVIRCDLARRRNIRCKIGKVNIRIAGRTEAAGKIPKNPRLVRTEEPVFNTF